jgi:hypothetical protein
LPFVERRAYVLLKIFEDQWGAARWFFHQFGFSEYRMHARHA